MITDAGLKYVKGLTHIRSLSLADTAITDAGLEDLRGSKLEGLDIQKSRVTQDGIDKLIAPHRSGWSRIRNCDPPASTPRLFSRPRTTAAAATSGGGRGATTRLLPTTIKPCGTIVTAPPRIADGPGAGIPKGTLRKPWRT